MDRETIFQRFRNLSIRTKLVGIAVITSFVTLVVASLILGRYDEYYFKETLTQNLSRSAKFIGINSIASIDFDYREEAVKYLEGFASDEHIMYAGIFLPDGEEFAQYFRTDLAKRESALPRGTGDVIDRLLHETLNPEGNRLPEEVQVQFRAGSVMVVEPIVFEDRVIGASLLMSDLNELEKRRFQFHLITAAVILVGSLIAWLLGSRLQKPVADPLLHLVKATRRIAENRDYTFRVKKQNSDEIGQLIDGFNQMLGEIQKREAELEESRDHLEEVVLDRTSNLLLANAELGREINERRVIEENLRVSRDQAEAAVKSKSEFLANMSHEIRTPMNGVIGMAEMLLQSELSERQHEFAMIIESSAGALLTILDDILDFSKIEAGQLTMESVPFSIQKVVEEIGQLHAARAGAKSLDLIIRYRPTSPLWVYGDPVRFRQIINNLVGNALKFTARGHVLIEVEVKHQSADREIVTIRIIDTGIGIPKEEQLRIFEKFTQTDSTTTREFGGTGLGLAISRQLAEMMGGKIGVESRIGEGSVFTFELPCNPSKPMIEDQSEVPDLLGKQALVIDDNEINRRVVVEYLGRWGMKCHEAGSGKEGLSVSKDLQGHGVDIDMILIDHNMPEMDGITLTENLRRIAEFQKTPIILYSSSYEMSIADVKMSGLFQGYLQKPLRPSRLLEEVRLVCHDPGGSRPASSSGKMQPSPPPTNPTEEEPAKGHEQFDVSILVVEDNLSNQFVAKAILGLFGCAIEIASNGAEAIEKVGKKKYDLVFMDCFMPVIDGLEATRRIRQNETVGEHTPIVAMTAHAIEGARDQCFDAG
ncbi:MAG: response regulator, partial [Candidatus Omnitrophica bacterium]|nr:response regulator [Candidatus Omnitrophota bacterium]